MRLHSEDESEIVDHFQKWICWHITEKSHGQHKQHSTSEIPFERNHHKQYILYFKILETKQKQFGQRAKCHTCIRAMKRKKALAARLICSYRNRGRKVRIPYLAVLEGKKGKSTVFKLLNYFKHLYIQPGP